MSANNQLILVSAGHTNVNGQDQGAVGNGYIEGKEAVAIRDSLATVLRKRGMSVIEDGADGVSEPLRKAIVLARKADVAIEIHFNGGPPSATGIEVLSKPGKKTLAQDLAGALHAATGIRLRGDRGWKSDTVGGGQHHRLAFCEAGGLIVEMCFISNVSDMALYKTNFSEIIDGLATVLAGDEEEIDLFEEEAPTAQTGSAGPNGFSDETLAPSAVESPNAEAVALSTGAPPSVPAEGDVVETEFTQKETFETAEGELSTEQKVTLTAGDAPNAAPSSWLSVEDWKPFVARWLKRAWTAVGTVSLPGGFGLGMLALKDPPNWFIYAAIAVVLIVIILGLGIIVSLVLLAIWYFNRKEISAAKIEEARSLVDPNLKNMGVIVERK